MPTSPDHADVVEVYRFGSIDSTSAQARREIESPDGPLIESPRLYVARTQTSGKGQRGRSWASPEGGLWCTLAVPWRSPWAKGELRGEALATLGVRLGLACVSTVYGTLQGDRSSVSIALKLPNDVLVHAKKVLGVLTEIVRRPNPGGGSDGAPPYLLVGIGINANFSVKALPPAIEPTATTLHAVLGREIDLENLRRTLLVMVMPALSTEPLDSSELTAVRACLFGRGRPTRIVTTSGLLVEGRLEGVDGNGAVLVSTPTGVAAGVLESSR